MITTVTISPEALPDAQLTFNDETEFFTVSLVTADGAVSLEGLEAEPRDPTRAEKQRGIVSANPPTVRAKDKRFLDRLLLESVEMALPPGTLDNNTRDGMTENMLLLDRRMCLLTQLIAIVRRLFVEYDKATGTT